MVYDIVIIHGWGGSINSLNGLKNELEKADITVLALELPGHGNTSLDEIWKMEQFGKWLLKSTENLVDEKTVFLGHSFGGKILIDLASQNLIYNDLILINSSGLKLKNNIKTLFWKFLSIFGGKFLPNKLKKLIYFYIIKERDYQNTKDNIFLKKTFNNVNKINFDKLIKNIKNRVLIIWGKNDKVTPVWMGDFLVENIKKSKLVIFEKYGHNLPIVSPEIILNQILEFKKV